ncbi:Rieske (2Fe-2S) protein [Methylobacter luteus]|uniref:Rieske (2Fe-2S) protein n=1 Tax=Methylobacter luteus TaxID=415 RepID=UPI0003F67DC7|nr:Rieske 2Fe-2S domain-containing protein [Methylobacter luteus]
MPADLNKICNIADLEASQCRQFNYTDASGALVEAMLVKTAGTVKAYQNACPHWEVEMNWKPDEFLSPEQTHIICAVHGALFRLDDGLCVFGPCVRQKLKPIPVQVLDGAVYLPPQARQLPIV